MIAGLAIVCLTLLSLALMVALLALERTNRRERQGLLDRIESPIASQAAATERLIPPRPEPVPEQPYYVPITDSDLQLADLLET
jgi:hypothetical protein